MKRPEATSPRTGFASQLMGRVARMLDLGTGRGQDLQLIALVAATWGGLQWYGRAVATSEWHDLGAAAALLFGIRALLGGERAVLPELGARVALWIDRVRTALILRAKSAWPRIGVDLVEEPPFPRGLPGVFWLPGLALAAVGLVFVVRPWADGFKTVEWCRAYGYPLYLVAVVAYWLAAAAVGTFGMLLPFVMIWNWACASFRSHDGRRQKVTTKVMTWTGAALALVLVAVPSQWAVVGTVLISGATLACLYHPAQPALTLIWRPRTGGGESEDGRVRSHRSVAWRSLQSTETLLLTGGCTLLMTVPTLGALTDAHWELAGVSACMRWFASLGGLFAVATLGVYRAHFFAVTSLKSPSRSTPRRVVLTGEGSEIRARAEKILGAEGWKVLDGSEPVSRSDDVRLVLDGEQPLESPMFADLARPIHPSLLEDKEILWRLKRRADVRSRRNLMKGLKGIFKEAAAALKGPGTGFILAPHQWFMLGLARDIADHDTTEDRSVEGFLQPEYRAVMSPRARHHLYLVLQAVGVDLIYVEDGVGYRRLAQALRVIFEIFDKHGVDRQVKGRDFVAVHGVHAIVHSVTPEAPRQSRMYPEPDYESETRARILHLYRDRGGDEEVSDAPVETDGIPLLV